jgi:hypothetical protein
VFISYSHDSEQHKNRVWELCERLRNDSINCRIDQHEFSPPEGWPRWCRNQVQESQFVVVVCTETYKQRYEGKAPAGEGKGAKWEGFIITLELYEAEGRNARFIPVVFSPEDAQHIPAELRGATRYDLSISEAYDNLFRHLTNQPAREKSPVAMQLRPMPPIARRQQFCGPVWNVPLPRNPFFTGREGKLEELGNALSSGGVAALTGMGGVGKTQIAAHFAHEHRGEHTAVLWASAASQETLVSDFAVIASRLNLPEKDEKDQALAVAAVKRWLEATGGWLLIFDNAGDLATVREFIPQSAGSAESLVLGLCGFSFRSVSGHRLAAVSDRWAECDARWPPRSNSRRSPSRSTTASPLLAPQAPPAPGSGECIPPSRSIPEPSAPPGRKIGAAREGPTLFCRS